MTVNGTYRSPDPEQPSLCIDRPKIAVLLPMVWGIRNIVYSGVLQGLAAAGVDVHLISRGPLPGDGHPDGLPFGYAAGRHTMVIPARSPLRGKALVDAVVRAAFMKRHKNGSYRIYRRWAVRNDAGIAYLRGRLMDALGTVAAHSPVLFRALVAANVRMYRASSDLQGVRTQLRELKPDLIWSTTCVDSPEYPYFLVASDLGIPILASILSFDNLTSRGVLPVSNYYTVWNESMREQLLRLYPQVSSDRVWITGSPQFDFHRRPEFLWNRETTLGALGLTENDRYFLYAASVERLAPAEPQLVRTLAERMSRHSFLRTFKLVVRLHPLDQVRRWEIATGGAEDVVVSRAWEREADASGWAVSSRYDQAKLVSTFSHAQACLNIASTATLDSAIVDRPVIGIRFDHEPAAPGDILYEEYDAEHYKPLVESGGLRIARTWDELLEFMREAALDPARDSSRRKAMVLAEAGRIDGCAADRVASVVAMLAKREQTARCGASAVPDQCPPVCLSPGDHR